MWVVSREVEKVVVIVGPSILGEMGKILVATKTRELLGDCWRRKYELSPLRAGSIVETSAWL